MVRLLDVPAESRRLWETRVECRGEYVMPQPIMTSAQHMPSVTSMFHSLAWLQFVGRCRLVKLIEYELHYAWPQRAIFCPRSCMTSGSQSTKSSMI